MIWIMSRPLVDLLSALGVRRRRVPVRGMVFRSKQPVRSLFIVESGSVQLTRTLAHGAEVTLQRALAGQVLAEASIFSDHYHCDAVALEDCVLRMVPLRKLHAALQSEAELNSALMRHLAHALQQARSQAEILALKTIDARIEAWKSLHGGALPPKGQWRTLATHIGVSPEALYRELARRRIRRDRLPR
jgi:CRP-like cAMP-binding protein